MSRLGLWRRLAIVLAGGIALAVPGLAVYDAFAADQSAGPPTQVPPAQQPVGKAVAPNDKAARALAAGVLAGHGGPVKAVRVDIATGRAMTGSFDYAAVVWDINGGAPKRLHRLDDHNGAVNAVSFLPGANRALTGSDDGAVSLWDLETGKLVHRFSGHQNKVIGLAISDDGKTAASASWDRTVRLWSIETLTAGPVLSGHKGPVNAVQFSSDGRHVYSASYDGTIGLWTRADGAFVRPLYKHGWGVNVLERVRPFANGGPDRLAFGALNGSAGLIDAVSGDKILDYKEHPRPVLALAIIDQPGLVATGGGDGVIRVSRIDDGTVIEEFHNPYGPVWALAFSANGAGLYYGGLDDFAGLWQVNPRKSFEPVASQFPRRFQVAGDSDDPVEQGRVQFARKCSVCHTLTLDGANRAGPSLHQIFGRRIATLPGYPYSPPLQKLDIVWTEETVAKLFELGPDVFTPGSKMPLQKMTDKSHRDALIAYLRQATRPQGEKPASQQGVGGGQPVTGKH